jgi:CheY-like chemotaxis protein
VILQVAEDNRINQKVLRMMLQANCAELTIVSDGQQAVDAYNKVTRNATAASATANVMVVLLLELLLSWRCCCC